MRGRVWDRRFRSRSRKERVHRQRRPPLLVCKGDLRLDVRYQERGSHGDAGHGVAYLLRRAAHEGGAATGAANVLGPPCQPAQSWDKYNEFRFRDHF